MTITDIPTVDGRFAREETRIPMGRQQFREWVGERHAEWAYGEAIFMAPDNTLHASLRTWLASIICGFVNEKGLGETFTESVETRLESTDREPDILFVSTARRHVIKRAFIDGGPDLAVEIVSPTSVKRDYQEKFGEYAAAGVREYWIVDPQKQVMLAYSLVSGSYQPITADGSGKISS